MEARLELTLFCYKPACFSHVNDHVAKLVSIRTTRFTCEKLEGLLYIKAKSPLASLALKGQIAKHTTVKWAIDLAGLEVTKVTFFLRL